MAKCLGTLPCIPYFLQIKHACGNVSLICVTIWMIRKKLGAFYQKCLFTNVVINKMLKNLGQVLRRLLENLLGCCHSYVSAHFTCIVSRMKLTCAFVCLTLVLIDLGIWIPLALTHLSGEMLLLLELRTHTHENW